MICRPNKKSLLMMFLAVVAFVVAQPVKADLLLHLTGNGSPLDSSPNGYHGSLVGNTTYGPGARGLAFQFDGSGDYVSIVSNPGLEPVSAMSVAAWAKMAPISGQKLIMDSSHGWIDSKGWLLQTLSSGQVGFGFGNGSFFPVAYTTSEVDDSTFHHLAGVFDGSTLSIYFDGILENQVPYSGTPVPSGRELRIGASWGGGTTVREVNGLIDDVRLYNHALSAAEVKALAIPEPTFAVLLGMLGIASVSLTRKPRHRRPSL